MKADFRIARSEDVQCEMTITMPLSAWKRLRDILQGPEYPEFRLRQTIYDLVRQAEAKFSHSVDEDGGEAK